MPCDFGNGVGLSYRTCPRTASQRRGDFDAPPGRVKFKRFDCLSQTFCSGLGGGNVSVRKKDAHFFATDSCLNVGGSAHVFDAAGDGFQNGVTKRMPVGVVDGFEMV